MNPNTEILDLLLKFTNDGRISKDNKKMVKGKKQYNENRACN